MPAKNYFFNILTFDFPKEAQTLGSSSDMQPHSSLHPHFLFTLSGETD